MNLSAETCLRGVLDTLNNRIAPVLPEGLSGELMRLASLVVTITSNSLDDAASLRVAENEAMRALFRDAATILAATGMAEVLQTAGNQQGSGLRISELDRDNDLLRGLLVGLHTHVEEMAGNEASAIASRIWRMLRDFEIARAPRR